MISANLTVVSQQRHRQLSAWFTGLAALAIFLSMLSGAFASESVGDAALFARLDTDKDNRITDGEVAAEHGRLIARLLRRGDEDHDNALSREEFAAALVPSRPDKNLELKRQATLPGANAVRWLLLTMDTNGNGWIEAREVPKELQQTFRTMAQRLDTDKNSTLDTTELYRGGPPLAQIAGRYVRQNSISVDSELQKLQREQGAAANRFEQRRGPFENLSDPQQARQLFAQLDANGDARVEVKEVPETLRRPIQRLLRTADRDGDGRLSQREFLAGARRIAARTARQSGVEKSGPDAMSNDDMAEKP